MQSGGAHVHSVFVVYEGVWFSTGRLRQGERSGKIPVIDAAVGDEAR